jgi:YbbR domain-containing protein
VNFLARFFLKDVKLKVFSLLVAVVLWFAISYMGESKMGVSVRVSPQNLGKNYMLRKMEPDDILITLAGPVSVLKNIRARDVRVNVDLSDARPGSQILAIQNESVEVAKGVKVEEIKPDYILVDIDRIVEKRLRVVVKLDPKWADIYRVKSVSPPYVAVEGSNESLKEASSLYTLPVDGDLQAEEETINAQLETKGMILRKVRPDSVQVILRRQ